MLIMSNLSLCCHCFFSLSSCVEYSQFLRTVKAATDEMTSLLIEISDFEVPDTDGGEGDEEAEDGVDA